MAEPVMFDSDMEDLRSEYDSENSDVDEARFAGDDDLRRRDARLRSSSIDKPRAPEEGKDAGPVPESVPPLLPSAPQQPRVWEEDSRPILDAGPLKPPPDYAAATAHREEEERQARVQSLESQGDQEWPMDDRVEAFGSEHPLVRNGLLRDPNVTPTEQPNSIDEPCHDIRQDIPDAAYSSSSEDPEKTEDLELINYWSSKRRVFQKRWLFIGLVALLLALLVYLSMSNASFQPASMVPTRPPTTDSWPMDNFQHAPAKPQLQHPPTSECVWSDYKTNTVGLSYTWDSDDNVPRWNFSFLESLDQVAHHVRLSGKVQIMSPTRELYDSARITVEIASTYGLGVKDVRHQLHGVGGFELLWPEFDLKQTSGCIDFAIKIEHEKGWPLVDFLVETANFDIDIDGDELFSEHYDPWTDTTEPPLWVENATFCADRGIVSGKGWEARRTEVRTTEGSITGTWPLRDTLLLNSDSGDIRVDVAPRAGVDRNRETPLSYGENAYAAELFATSVDGIIRCDIAQDEGVTTVPERDYRAHIGTVNGDIYGDYLLGSNASIVTESGEMNVRIVPVILEPPNATLYSENGSGLSNVWVLKPVTGVDSATGLQPRYQWPSHPPSENGTMSSLRTTHKSGSGSLHYVLPTAWSGTGVLESEAVPIVTVEVYEVVKEEKGDMQRMWVRRGHSGSQLHLEASSGHVYLDAYDG